MLEELFTKQYYGHTIVQWASAFGGVLFSFILGSITGWILNKYVKKVAAKFGKDLGTALLEVLEKPVRVVVVGVGIWFSLTTFLSLPEKMVGAVNWGYYFLLVAMCAWTISGLVAVFMQQFVLPWIERTGNDLAKSAFHPFQSALRFFIWFLAVVIGLDSAGYDIGAVLAGLGIGGLAVAMAARETISDVLGGITLILTRPFKPGDLVDYKGRWVKVVEIGIRVSLLEDFGNNALITAPNSHFTNNEVVNYSAHPGSMVLMNLRLSLETPPEKVDLALAQIADIIGKHERTRFIWIKLNHFDEYAYVLRLHYDILAFKERNKVKTEINLAMAHFLHKNGVKFAEFPVSVGGAGGR